MTICLIPCFSAQWVTTAEDLAEVLPKFLLWWIEEQGKVLGTPALPLTNHIWNHEQAISSP